MRQLITSFYNRTIFRLLVSLGLLCGSFTSCNKNEHFPYPENNDASKYSSDVIDKWLTLQIRLYKDAIGIPNVAFARFYAYSGVAALEALAPGSILSASTKGKWNGLINLPEADKSNEYYWPASVNASLAFMNRSIFTTANAADKAAIDSLENVLNASYLLIENRNKVARSDSFGKAIASAIFNWSETDGYKNQSNPYTPPAGPGLWVPTPPAFAPASTPYLGKNRPIIAGSTDNTQPGPPIPYSEDPKSAFYQMAAQVYGTSQTLTPDQIAQGLFWRDFPGATAPGHWESILQQVLKQTHSPLDKAAYAYAISGVCLNDAAISCWQTKYHYNMVRPITYIRTVMGYTTWNALFSTPTHPEYSAAHAVLSAATAQALNALFGNIGSFTDHTYDYLGFAPRTFSSLSAMAEDAGNSRLYGGVHYQPSIDTGLIQGRKVTANILRSLELGADRK